MVCASSFKINCFTGFLDVSKLLKKIQPLPLLLFLFFSIQKFFCHQNHCYLSLSKTPKSCLTSSSWPSLARVSRDNLLRTFLCFLRTPGISSFASSSVISLNSNVLHDGRTLHRWRSFESKVGT